MQCEKTECTCIFHHRYFVSNDGGAVCGTPVIEDGVFETDISVQLTHNTWWDVFKLGTWKIHEQLCTLFLQLPPLNRLQH